MALSIPHRISMNRIAQKAIAVRNLFRFTEATAIESMLSEDAFASTSFRSPSRFLIRIGLAGQAHAVLTTAVAIPSESAFFPAFLQAACLWDLAPGTRHFRHAGGVAQPRFDVRIKFRGQSCKSCPELDDKSRVSRLGRIDDLYILQPFRRRFRTTLERGRIGLAASRFLYHEKRIGIDQLTRQ